MKGLGIGTCALATALVLVGLPASASQINVHPADPAGWAGSNFDSSSGTWAASPTSAGTFGSFSYGEAPSGGSLGSWEQTLAATGDRQHVSTPTFNHVQLWAFSRLRYWTRVEGGSCFICLPLANGPALQLVVDLSGDGRYEDNVYDDVLTFSPEENGAITRNVWQQWDAIAGTWTSARLESLPTPPGPITLADYAAAYPQARLVEKGMHGLAAVAFGETYHGWVDLVDVQLRDVDGNTADFTFDFDPTPGTVEILDGGDGLLGAAEVVNGIPVRWTANGSLPLLSAALTFSDAAGNAVCTSAVAASGTGAFPCALPEGRIEVAAQWFDTGGRGSLILRVTSLLDTIAPVATIDIEDGDGLISGAEISAGVNLRWSVTDSGPPADITLAQTALPAPAACTLAGVSRGPASMKIPAACIAALGDGEITATVVGLDESGNVGTATDTSILRRAGAFTIEVLDGVDNPQTGIIDFYAGIDETEGGTALKVRFDLDVASNPVPVAAVVRVTDDEGRSVTSAPQTIEATASDVARTVSVDVTTLSDGPIDISASITDNIGNTGTKKAKSFLDLHKAQTTWTTANGTRFVRVNGIVVQPNTVVLSGVSREQPEGSGIGTVYLDGRNLDTREILSRTATLTNRNGQETSWELRVPLSPGRWRITSRAFDLADNFEDPNATIEIEVLGT